MQLIEILSDAGEFQAQPKVFHYAMSQSRQEHPIQRRKLLWTEPQTTLAVLALVEIGCAVVLLPACVQFLKLPLTHTSGAWRIFLHAWVGYVAIHLVAGPILSLAAVHSQRSGRQWAPVVQRVCVWTAFFTGLLAPIAACHFLVLAEDE
jgi:hypothetical protein